jgi:hypothetical protein
VESLVDGSLRHSELRDETTRALLVGFIGRELEDRGLQGVVQRLAEIL